MTKNTILFALCLPLFGCDDPDLESVEDEDEALALEEAEADWQPSSAENDDDPIKIDPLEDWQTTPTSAVQKCFCITQCSSNPPHWTSWKNVGYVKGQSYGAAEHNCKQQAKGFCKALAWNYTHVKPYCGFH